MSGRQGVPWEASPQVALPAFKLPQQTQAMQVVLPGPTYACFLQIPPLTCAISIVLLDTAVPDTKAGSV